MRGLCGTRGCDRPIRVRGFCESHYRKLLRKGYFGYRDPTAVLGHLRKLRDAGWSWCQIGEAAGISWSVPHGLWHGRYRRVQADCAKALLAVPARPIGSHRGVDSVGMRRRLQALSWMGWPTAEVARRIGVRESTLRTLVQPSRRPSWALHLKVAALYDELSGVRGPSMIAAGRARGAGFAPPAAWDDDTIDDPLTRPAGVQRPVSRRAPRTHCLRGHRLVGKNLHVGSDGKRRCRICRADKQAERMAS